MAEAPAVAGDPTSSEIEKYQSNWHIAIVGWCFVAIYSIVILMCFCVPRPARRRWHPVAGYSVSGRTGRALAAWRRRGALVVALAGAVAWTPPLHAAQGAKLQIRDDRGITVTLAAPPQRIVSLLPSLAETVCELSQCQRLVGVDRYANWPAAVRKLPRVGGGLDPDIEAVLALKPDLVLLATSSRAAARLEALGIKVVALEPKSHADVRRVLGQVALLLGLPTDAGERVWRQIDAAVDEAAASVPLQARGARVYFEVSSGPYAAGEASFIGETLHRLGARNIVPASLGMFPKLNPEFVVRADPDLIMIGDENFTSLAGRPGWAAMRAVKTGKVCVFTPTKTDAAVRAGPRMAEGARLLADCLATLAPPSVQAAPVGAKR